MEKPSLIAGGMSYDDRGIINYVNDFDLSQLKRFYIVSNYSKHTIRAWHGHEKESKSVYCLNGAATICLVPLTEFEKHPEYLRSTNIPDHYEKFVLNSKKPGVLNIPPGYANGWMPLTDDTSLLFFSNSSLSESKSDDKRYPANLYRDLWKVQEC